MLVSFHLHPLTSRHAPAASHTPHTSWRATWRPVADSSRLDGPLATNHQTPGTHSHQSTHTHTHSHAHSQLAETVKSSRGLVWVRCEWYPLVPKFRVPSPKPQAPGRLAAGKKSFIIIDVLSSPSPAHKHTNTSRAPSLCTEYCSV